MYNFCYDITTKIKRFLEGIFLIERQLIPLFMILFKKYPFSIISENAIDYLVAFEITANFSYNFTNC